MGKLSEAETKKALAKIEEYKKQSQKKRRKQGRPALYEDFMREPVGQKEADRYRSAVKVLDTEYKLGMTGYPKPRGVKKPKSKQEGGLLERFGRGLGKIIGSGTAPQGQTGRGSANTLTGKIVTRKSVKEKKAAKRQADFKKASRPAGRDTSANINPYKSTTQSTAKKGDRFGAKSTKSKGVFPKTKGAYTIQKGDTLSGIAKKSGTTVAKLMSLNPGLKDPNKIRAGAGLNLGTKGTQAPKTKTKVTDPRSDPRVARIFTKPKTSKAQKQKQNRTTVRPGRGTTGDRGNQKQTTNKKTTTPGLQGRKERRRGSRFATGGMAEYIRDLI